MNNAFIIKEDVLKEESPKDSKPEYRKRVQELTDIIEALHHVGSSSYWKVLKQYVFDVDLDKAKRSLAKEEDTTEMFRLQGEIKAGERLDLEVLAIKYRNELEDKRNKL